MGTEGTAFSQASHFAYSYDALRQVTAAERFEGVDVSNPGTAIVSETFSYAYHTIGNRLESSTGSLPVTEYTANLLNKYTAAGSATPVYDKDGYLIEQSGWEYKWNAENRSIDARPVSPTSSADHRLTFEYDAEGRRVQKPVCNWSCSSRQPLRTHTFVWSGWDLLIERVEDHTSSVIVHNSFLRGLDLDGSQQDLGGVGALLAIREHPSGSTYLPVIDGRGNLTALVDAANGEVVARYEYGAFGEPLGQTGPAAAKNPFRFSTKYTDQETGLVYFGFRYLDPERGRWLSREPLGERESPNLYAFAGNDPVNFVDVLGLARMALDPVERFELWYQVLRDTNIIRHHREGFDSITPEEIIEDQLTSYGLFGLSNPSWGGIHRNAVLRNRYPDYGTEDIALMEAARTNHLRARMTLARAGFADDKERIRLKLRVLGGTMKAMLDGAMIVFSGPLRTGGRAVSLPTNQAAPRVLLQVQSPKVRQAARSGGLDPKWTNIAGEWRGWKHGFADTGRYRWSGSNGMRARYGQSSTVKPYDAIHHRIFPQGGTRGGAGKLTLQGFFGEQYGRYIPNFIKNTRWNMRNLGQPKYRGGSGLHEALHGTNPEMRLKALKRIWYGTNAWDKIAIGGTGIAIGAGAAYFLDE